MAWLYRRTRALSSAEAIRTIDDSLDKLQRALTTPDPLVHLTMSSNSVRPDMSRGVIRTFVWGVTTTGAWTIQNPIGMQSGAIIILDWGLDGVASAVAPTFGSYYTFTSAPPALAGGRATMVFVALTPTDIQQISAIPAPAGGGGGGGEANTGSNVNTAGIGVFKQKTGVNLEFRGIDAATSRISVALDSVNNTVDVDVAEASLNLANMGGQIGNLQIAPSAVGTNKIADNAVTLVKLADIATDRLLGRQTAGTGDPEEIVCTAAGRALIDDADAAAQRTTLGLLALATKNTVATADIDNDAVTYAKIQNVSATDRLLGRQTAGAGDAEEIVCTAAGRALIDDASAAAQRTTLGLEHAVTSADQATFANAQTNVTGLSFAIGANEVWVVDVDISVTMVLATGVKFYATGPAGVTGEIQYFGSTATLNTTFRHDYQAVITVPGTFYCTVAGAGYVRMRLTVRTAGTAGTIQIVGITGGATTTCAVKKGSSLVARRSTP